MATLLQLQDALRAADAAGNTEDAKRLASAIANQSPAPVAPAADQAAPAAPQGQPYHRPLTAFGAPIPDTPISLSGPSADQRAQMPQQWANAGVLERMKLMMQASPQYAASSNLGTAQGAAGMAGPAIGATVGGNVAPRVGIPAPIGRFAGGAVGDLAGQQAGRSLAEAQGQQPQPIQYGRALGAGVSSMFGGGSLAGASAKRVAAVGAGYGAGNVAGMAVQTAVDQQRAPTAEEAGRAFLLGAAGAPAAAMLDSGSGAERAKVKASQGATNLKTLKEGQAIGYAVPPSFVKSDLATNVAESYAGKAATAQQAIQKNQPVTNQLARDWLGLSEGAALDAKEITTARVGPNSLYDKVSKMSPQASLLLDQYKQAKAESRYNHYQYKSQMGGNYLNPEVQKAAQQADAQAAQHLQAIEAEGARTGNAGITGKLKEAEEKLAKIGVVEKGIAGGNGRDVSASVFSEAEAKGITDEGRKIGDFYDAFGRAMRDAADSPAPGVNKLSLIATGAAGALGAAKFGPQGAMAAAVPYMMEGPARGALLSKFYQQRFVNPNFGPQSLDAPASLARFAAQAQGRTGGGPQMSPAGDPAAQNAPASMGSFAQPNPLNVPLSPRRASPSNEDNKKELERLKRLNRQ